MPRWGTDLEEGVFDSLMAGGGPSHDQNIAILKTEMASPLAKTKGYVLDLNFYKPPDLEVQQDGSDKKRVVQQSWKDIIRKNQLLGAPDQYGTVAEFSHVIELELEDDEVKLRAQHMLMDLDDGVVYSRWEIAERNRPPPKQFDEEGQEIPYEPVTDPEDPAYVKRLVPADMIQRIQDTETFLQEELLQWQEEKKAQIDDFIVKLHNHQYLKIDVAGLTPDECVDSIQCIVRPDETVPLRPIAMQPPNEAGDFKGLLSEPLKEEQEGQEGELPRVYGLWQQTDPVALYDSKVLPGQPGLGVAYANTMFAFANEENRDAFVKEPKKYLVKAPEMPKSYRLMMVGPKGIGVHT